MPWSKDGNIRGPQGPTGSPGSDANVTAHEGAADPHPGYLTQTEGDARYRRTAVALVDADIPAEIARDAEVTAAISTHAATPHGGAGGADGRLIVNASTSNQTVAGSALVALTGCSFPVEANSTYHFQFEVDVFLASGTTPTHNYSITGPASPTRFMARREQMTAATAVTFGVVTALGTLMGAGAAVANTKTVIRGIIVTGAAGGTVQLNVTPAGTSHNSTFGRGSGVHAVKVA